MAGSWRACRRALALALTAGLGAGCAPRASEDAAPPEVQVARAPTPVTVEGAPALVYELHIVPRGPLDLALTRLEVLDADRPDRPIADFEGASLAALLGGSEARGRPDGGAVIPAGTRAVAYLWLALGPAAPAPRALRHRITFREGSAPSGDVVEVECALTDVSDDRPVVLGAPLRGGPWVAVYDPAMERGHRRVLLETEEGVRIPARFAIDWIKVDDRGGLARGDGSRVEDWLGYGADALAVADGRVVAVRDSMAESATVSHVAHGLDKASGNHVVLEVGEGRYVSYEHLKPGSVRVQVGDSVREGQTVAQLGYTGDSTGPHLHVHVSDGGTPLGGEGLPFVLRGFRVLGSYPSIDALGAGPWTPAPGGPAVRALELPAANTVVDFGPSRAGPSADLTRARIPPPRSRTWAASRR